jgi:hypothetical protein
MMQFTVAALAAAVSIVGFVDAFSASSNANMAVYYGQNSRNIVGAQANLAAYCQGIQFCVLLFTNARFNVGCNSMID